MHAGTPTGLVGVSPKDPIGVHVTVGIKSATSGAPVLKDRFWFMTRNAATREFRGAGRAYKALAREMDPSFVAWNEMAKGPSGDGKTRDPRSAVIRGNIVHSNIADAVFWNRSAHRLPEPHPNPPSQYPACEGNGIWARRYSGIEHGREVFEEISCPNEECIFAQTGLCKVFASLLFQLRWSPSDPFESQFPRMLAHWSTRGIHSANNLLGLFEYVLGTDAVMPRDKDGQKPEDWKAGLAAEMGIEEPSLFGMPFVMQVGEKTSLPREGREGRRFPVVTFSPDGDLMDWLVHQRRQRELAGGSGRLALPAATSVRDPEYLEVIRHEARQELDVTPVEVEPAATAETIDLMEALKASLAQAPAKTQGGPALLSPAKVEALSKLAEQRGVSAEALAAECARIAGTGSLAGVPAAQEADLMKYIEQNSKRGGKRR